MEDLTMVNIRLESEPDAATKEVLEELDHILGRMGSMCRLLKRQDLNGYNEPITTYSIGITLDQESIKRYVTRGAGRPTKGFYISAAEIREMLETKTAAEVAKELGISRSTLFRRLAEDGKAQ